MVAYRILLAALLLAGLPASGGAVPVPVTVAPSPPSEAQPLSEADVAGEIVALREALVREVPHLVGRTGEGDAAWVRLAQAEVANAGMVIDRAQLVVVVDRNPRVQQLALMVAVPQGEWVVLGGTRVSTGQKGRVDHFITPRGVFHNTTAIVGYRAEGTLNENGIRGLGSKGMRVWDFGWQMAAKGWDAGPGKPDRLNIRLMMHATDPDRLEQRLGSPASQGCVRIPSAMNRFLDRHGVVDAAYEAAAATDVRFRQLLPAGRTPTRLAGDTVVVVDSGDRGTSFASRTIP